MDLNTKKICDQLHITQKLLRTFEEKGLVEPERGENNYRNYTLDDIVKIKCVMLLRELGFSYPQIRTILDNTSGSADGFEQIFYIHLNSIKKKLSALDMIRGNLTKCINDFLKSNPEVGNALATIVRFESKLSFQENQLADYQWDFDSWADQYDENVVMKSPEHVRTLVTVADYIRKNMKDQYVRTLDMGCGSCYLWRGFEGKNLDIIAVDTSLKMLFYAKEKMPWIHYLLGDATEEFFHHSEKFNLVTATFLLHHISRRNHYTVLNNLRNLMEKHGTLILADRMFYDEDDVQTLRETYIKDCAFDKLEHMSTEHFPFVTEIQAFFEGLHYPTAVCKVDTGVWMIVVKNER